MNAYLLAFFASLICQPDVQSNHETFPQLAMKVPYLQQRIHSTRWEARYALVGELTGSDSQTKRVLEILATDDNPQVAAQALVRYVDRFIEIDEASFKPEVYLYNQLVTTKNLDEHSYKVLVDYCLGRGALPEKEGIVNMCSSPGLAVLDLNEIKNPQMANSLTLVGILGESTDAQALYPFLDSDNDYIAVTAAVAVIRLGDKDKGEQTLLRLINQDPREHLYYITKSLRFLQEISSPHFETQVLQTLTKVDQAEHIQVNWLNDFLLLTAEVKSDLWNQ